MPYVSFVVVCCIWGSSFVLMKRAMLGLSPIEVGAWRDFGGAVVLALIFLLARRQFAVRKQDFIPLLGVAILGFAWPHSVQPELVGRIGGAFVGMTVGMTPLLTIFVSIPILGVFPTPRQVFGIIGALVCMAILMEDGLRHHVALSDLLVAFSVPTTYSIANCWIRRRLRHLPPLELTMLCLGTASCVLLPLSVWFEDDRTLHAPHWPIAVASVAILGIAGTGIATLLFNKLVQDQGPLFATMTTNIVPVGAVLWGWADGERITAVQLAALVGILVMVSIVQFGAAQPVAPPPKS
jgi:drug/metabolite transporter (DMT)-like permease